jgi:hypothetical protein
MFRTRVEPLLTRRELDGVIVMLMRIDEGVATLLGDVDDEEDDEDGEETEGPDA